MAIHHPTNGKNNSSNNNDSVDTTRVRARDHHDDDINNDTDDFNERVNKFAFGSDDSVEHRRKANPNRGMSSAFEARSVSKRFSDLMSGFRTLIKEGVVSTASGARLVEFDGEKYGLVYPAVIALLPQYDYNGEITDWSYSILIVEDDSNRLADRVDTENGSNFSLPRTPFDLFNEYYNECVQETIVKELSKLGLATDVNLIYGRVSCVYNTVDVTDLNNCKHILQELGRQCMTPLYPETIQDGTDETARIGEDIRAGEYSLEASLEFRPHPMVDDSGLPVARDLLIRVKAIGNDNNGRGRNRNQMAYVNNVYPITDVSVMLDLVHVGAQQDMGYRSRRDRLRRSADDEYADPIYIGNVIVTQVGNQDTYTTISRALIALATSTIAQSEEVYPEMLKPQRGNSTSLGGLAAVGYQIPDEEGVYGPLQVDSAAFTADGNAALLDTVYQVLYPDLMMSIDIPEAALGSRVLSLFQGQSNADIKAIASAMDSLTNNNFSRLFDYSGRITREIPNLIPLGYWVDAQGKQRDLREINYLAALDYAGRMNDMAFIDEWSETFLMPDPSRGASIRLGLMADIVGGADNIVVKAYAWRYLLERDFIEAVYETLADAGIAPTVNNLVETDRRRLKSSVADFENYMVDHQSVSRFTSRVRRGHNDRGRTRGSLRGQSRW